MAKAAVKRKAKKALKAKHYQAGLIPGQSAAGHKPFKSKAQARLFFANPRLRKWAIGKAHATGMHSEITHAVGYSPAYRALPNRKGSTYKRVPLRPGGKKAAECGLLY